MARQISWSVVALATVLAIAPASVGAQPESIRIGKKGEIQLTQPTWLGTRLLEPGLYEVQHAAVEGEHFVIVRRQMQMDRQHAALVTGSEVARVKCRVKSLDKPARFSFAYWTAGADGKATITEIRVAEEPAGHIIALEPSRE